MAGMKRLAQKIADDNLQLFYVHISTDQGTGAAPIWAENAGDAGYKADNMFPYENIELIETQDEYEARIGEKLFHGRLPNL